MIIGKKFGVLTVLGYTKSHKSPNGRIYKKVECLCDDCGGIHVKFKNTLHDNCICTNKAHRKTHGKAHTPIYNIWYGIKQRCYYVNSVNYKNYGGRGITMCDEWKNDFMNFYTWAISNNYHKGLTIDRIDVNGNYEPKNCRWVDKFAQANNKRNNILYTYNGKTYSLKKWCRLFGISYKTCMTRYYRGHSIEECLNLKPLNDTRKGKNGNGAILVEYENKTYSIGKLADFLGIKRWKMYEMFKRGEIPKGVNIING